MTSIEDLLKTVHSESKLFIEKVKNVRDIPSAEIYFGKFIGSQTFRKAIELAEDSKKNKKLIINQMREGLSELCSISGSWNHSLNKPYGYPGDFAILELLYNQEPHPNTKTVTGKSIDLWAQSTILGRAVNTRKNALKILIKEFAADYSKKQQGKILSIASGSAREIRELPEDILEKLNVTLLDQDQRALDFALSKLKTNGERSNINTVVADALASFEDKQPVADNAPFDLIYSFGLYDYLPDKWVKKSINMMLPVLDDDGRFIFALKDKEYYPHWFYEWFYNWKFFQRTKEDGLKLADDNNLEVVETAIIESGCVVLYICKKK